MILFPVDVKIQSFSSVGYDNLLLLILFMMMSSNIKPLDMIHIGSYSQSSFCLNGYIILQAVKKIFLMEVIIHCQMVEMSILFFLIELIQTSKLYRSTLMDIQCDLKPNANSNGFHMH